MWSWPCLPRRSGSHGRCLRCFRRTPRAIRDALVGAEQIEFEQRYAEEMATAGRTLDLAGVLAVPDTYRRIADITQWQGADGHLRMLDQVANLENDQEVTTTRRRSARDRAADLSS
jgi:uncharacterized protein DUF6247